MEPNQNTTPQTNPVQTSPQAATVPIPPTPSTQVNKTSNVKYGSTVFTAKPAILELKGDQLTLTSTDTKQVILSTPLSALASKGALGGVSANPLWQTFKFNGKKYNLKFDTPEEGLSWSDVLNRQSANNKQASNGINLILKIGLGFVFLLMLIGFIAHATHK